MFSILEQPIVNLSILKNGKFTGHVIAFFLFQIVNLGMSFIILNYIQLVNHSSSTVAGILVFPGAIIGSVKGSLMAAVEPISSVVFTVILMHDVFYPMDFLGILLTIVAVLLISLRDLITLRRRLR